MEIQVTDFEEQLAVWEGHIEGFVYDDGEVWAETESLEKWRAAHPPKCPHCGVLTPTSPCPRCAA